MSFESDSEQVYVFDLHMRCGGYAYFSTFTIWDRDDSSGHEVRKPSTATRTAYLSHLEAVGRYAILIRNHDDFKHWLLKKGWSFVEKAFAFRAMEQWLQEKPCLKGPLGTYTACELANPGAVKHYAAAGKRTQVMNRDGIRCVLCGRGPDETRLTMQHIIPHSIGGETTASNLVTLCDDCNGRLGSEYMPALYELAGLPNGFDPSLIATDRSRKAISSAIQLSSNLMHARCGLW